MSKDEESNFDVWVRTQVGKLWTALTEALVILWGPNKDDGLMTKVGKLDERCDKIEDKVTTLEGRECVEVAKVGAKGASDSARWQLYGVLIVQIASILVLLLKK